MDEVKRLTYMSRFNYAAALIHVTSR